MTLVVVGVSHKTAGVELRGKLAVPADRLRADLSRLLANDEVSEAVVLSTCNRTEAYAVVLAAPKGVRAIVETLRRNAGLDADGVRELDRALVVKQGPGAVEHLFRVVSSLDSLVLGEAQIIGQVRRAFAAAEDAGAVGETTRRLFRSALEVGKRVREETAIGERPVSVSTAAVQLAERALGELRGRRALVVGTGEMGLLALSYLEERGVSDIVVANRTFERAEEAAARVGGTPAMLDELGERLAQADLVVACATRWRAPSRRAVPMRRRSWWSMWDCRARWIRPAPTWRAPSASTSTTLMPPWPRTHARALPSRCAPRRWSPGRQTRSSRGCKSAMSFPR